MSRKPGTLDRAAGVMVGLACGDALGAAYEFGGPYPADKPVEMKGGGPFGWEPGEWTDDTSMAIPLLQLIETGERPRGWHLDPTVRAWIDWARKAKDVGNQTSAVLGETARKHHFPEGLASAADSVAHEFQRRFPDAAGNGSLMRTAPYGLTGQDMWYAAITAEGQSELTHPHRDAVMACAVWSAAIFNAVQTGELDLHSVVRSGSIRFDGDEERDLWLERIREAEEHTPDHFTNNGWVVQAFQGAWSAITHTGRRADNDPDHVRRALELAVRGGNDTDTVAAIAGGLIGGAYGVSAIPLEWKRRIHGWPGWRADDLVAHAVMASLVTSNEKHQNWDEWPLADRLDYSDWASTDTCVPHPHDPGVLLGGVGSLDRLPEGVDAVVSLCRIGRKQVPEQISAENRVSVWLVDSARADDNQHLDFVLREAADMVASMRSDGKTVLLHCVQAHSRTPTVGALYSALHMGAEPSQALSEVCAVLPEAHPNPAFVSALHRIVKESAPDGR